MFRSIEEVAERFAGLRYITSRTIATVVYLAAEMKKPILVEGPAGVGKTELAKVLASALGHELIRLQCYEGLDEAKALYEWEYAKQLLYTQLLKDKIAETIAGAGTLREAADRVAGSEDLFFSERFLLPRPVLAAIRSPDPALLLVDEIDKADPEFEAFLLEVLADNAVTIPELGTIRPAEPPIVVLTSNRTRELHDALKRRCLYHWVSHPDLEREVEIIRRHEPEVADRLARQVAAGVAAMRAAGLVKPPGIAEAIDWATALRLLGATELTSPAVRATLGALLKYREDQVTAERDVLPGLLARLP
jgi:MoxR-like ATPase